MNIDFVLLKSEKLSSENILDIINLFNDTFSNSLEMSYFNWKYLQNPFGSSLHLLGYLDNKLILSRSFWNVNFKELRAYQCVDTCVSPIVQGKGIFKKSQLFLDESFNDLSYYNLPNNISKPIYLRLGWKIIKKTKIKLTFPFLVKKCVIKFSQEELNWRYVHNNNKKYYKIPVKGGYVICFLKYKFLPIAIGFTSCNVNLKKCYFPYVFSYDSGICGISIPNKTNVVIAKNFTNKTNFYNFDMF